MGRKRFEYEIRGYRYAPESFRAFKGLPGQKMEQISLSGEQRRKMGYLCMTQGGKAGVRRAKDGDHEAITSILLMYRPLLLKYAVINGRLDEDLYQELCITLMRAIDLFRI